MQSVSASTNDNHMAVCVCECVCVCVCVAVRTEALENTEESQARVLLSEFPMLRLG